MRPQPGETFVDVGSGVGKAVLAAALLHVPAAQAPDCTPLPGAAKSTLSSALAAETDRLATLFNMSFT